MKTLKLLLSLFIPLAIVISGCEKATEEPKNTETTSTVVVKKNNIDSTTFFKATIDGVQKNIFADTLYRLSGGDSLRAIPGGYEYAPFSIILKSSTDLSESGGIMFILDTTNVNLDSLAYRNLIKTKSYSSGSLSTSTKSKGVNGVRIFYIDAAKVLWATDKGTADQVGSYFTVTEYKDSYSIGFKKKIKATFNCNLFDGKGNVKTITNGSFSGSIMTK